jgi:predicted phage terminase large subunit-like protein
LTAFQAMVKRWPQATAKLVEDKANGTAVISTLKSKIPGIIEITPTESKYARANAVAPIIEAGNAFLPEKPIGLFDPDELTDEAAGFPNATHDDQVDATSQALAYLLLDQSGAHAWINHFRALAASGQTDTEPAGDTPPADDASPDLDPVEAMSEDPAVIRKRMRDARFRDQQ